MQEATEIYLNMTLWEGGLNVAHNDFIWEQNSL